MQREIKPKLNETVIILEALNTDSVDMKLFWVTDQLDKCCLYQFLPLNKC